MPTLFKKLFYETEFSPKLTLEQCFIRNSVHLLVVAITLIAQYFGDMDVLDTSVVVLGIAYVGIGITATFLVHQFPHLSKIISVTGVITDTSIVCFIMYMGGEKEAALYGLLLFLVIANGLRFGKTHMKFANIVVVIGYLIVILFNDFWQEHAMMSIGNMIWLILIPAHINNLLSRLEVAVENAESSNQEKSMFIANMSHEIRTPLTSIIGFSKTLLNKNSSQEKKDIAVETIIRNSEHLSIIINDILDISKIEAGEIKIDKGERSLFEILHEIDLIFKTRAEAKNLNFIIHYQFPLPKLIYSDSLRIKQVLINLCSNAIKFTNKGGITIHVHFPPNSNMIQISVADTGIGLTKSQTENIFSIFSQADNSTTRNFGGTGLGLSISTKLAEMLGGKLWVESTKGKGSEFFFTFSVGDIAGRNTVNELPEFTYRIDNTEQLQISVTGRVLLVEDVIDNQILISSLLEVMGATVDIANNGQIALNKTANTTYDLILMDLQMPIMGGKEALVIMRQRGYTKPIVFLTANVVQNEEKKSKDCDCQGFLSKPIDESQFSSVIQKFLLKDQSHESYPQNYDKKNHSQESLDQKKKSEDVIISTLILNKPDRYHKIVKIFVSELNERISEIETAFISGDKAELINFVHNMKGLGGNMGFSIITEISTEIENAIESNDNNKIKKSIADLYHVERRIKKG